MINTDLTNRIAELAAAGVTAVTAVYLPSGEDLGEALSYVALAQPTDGQAYTGLDLARWTRATGFGVAPVTVPMVAGDLTIDGQWVVAYGVDGEVDCWPEYNELATSLCGCCVMGDALVLRMDTLVVR